MTLEKIQKDMVAAMKSGEKGKKIVLSGLVGAIKKAAIDAKTKDSITEDLVNKVILKELKTAKEMIDTCPVEREDLISDYLIREEIISQYCPVMMSEQQIRVFICSKVHEKTMAGEVTSFKTLVGPIMKELKGKCDAKIANAILVEICNRP